MDFLSFLFYVLAIFMMNLPALIPFLFVQLIPRFAYFVSSIRYTPTKTDLELSLVFFFLIFLLIFGLSMEEKIISILTFVVWGIFFGFVVLWIRYALQYRKMYKKKKKEKIH